MARGTSDAVIAYYVTMIIIITLLLTPITGKRAREPKFTHSYRSLVIFVHTSEIRITMLYSQLHRIRITCK